MRTLICTYGYRQDKIVKAMKTMKKSVLPHPGGRDRPLVTRRVVRSVSIRREASQQVLDRQCGYVQVHVWTFLSEADGERGNQFPGLGISIHRPDSSGKYHSAPLTGVMSNLMIIRLNFLSI